jgi:hypothetical protein
MFRRPLGCLALATFSLSLLPSRAATAADGPTEAQLSAARALFIAAEKDEDAERWSDALEKLQRVAQVKLTSGVRYHTALCETDRIPRVVVVLVPTLPEATVRLDGQPVAVGVPLPVDPGTHTIDAHAPGRSPSATTVTLQERDSTSVEVKLEPLDPLPAPPAVVPMHEPPAPVRENGAASRDRTLALITAAGAVGLGAAGLGAYLAASREHTDSVQACAQVVSNLPDACDSRKNTVRAWDWISVGAWTGAAAAGTVAVLSLLQLHRDAVRRDSVGNRMPSPSACVVLGPAAMGVEGTF